MRIRIEFYRSRDLDDARAVLGRVNREADDLDDAVEIARSLLNALEMPQRPDAMTISDADGKELYCSTIDHRTERKSLPAGDLSIPKGPTDMNSHENKSGEGCDPVADGENRRDCMDHHHGLRIEGDRSWTVYHVFTGVPATSGGKTMVGLGQTAATNGMLSMNLRNASRRNERISLNTPRLDGGEIEAPGWL